LPVSPLTSLIAIYHIPASPATQHLSLHAALPIYVRKQLRQNDERPQFQPTGTDGNRQRLFHALEREYRTAQRTETDCYLNLAIPDRKSTRLNSSHVKISYAVFCLKRKNKL